MMQLFAPKWCGMGKGAIFLPPKKRAPGWLGYMGVSKNSGTPKSSILIGFSIINHPFWGTTIFGNTHIVDYTAQLYGDKKQLERSL